MRLRTGVAGFDEMVQGGLPEGTSVVLQGPPGQEKVRFALTFLAEGLKAGASGIVLVSSQSPDSILAELRDLEVDLDAVTRENRLRIVDWYTQREEPVQDVEERGIVFRSSIDLTNVGVALSRAIAALGGTLPKRAVVELLSPAMSVYEVSQVYAFAQSSRGKFARFNFTALFLIEKDMHSAADLSTLHQPFDGVIEIERTRVGDNIVRKIGVLHLKDTTPDSAFRAIVMTEEGLRITREAPPLPSAAAAPAPAVPAAAPEAGPRAASTAPKPRAAAPKAAAEKPGESPTRAYLIMQIARERLKLNPGDADALFAMAAAQATLDDARGALESLDRLSKIDERYPGLWVLKTKLHARLGEAERARASRAKAEQTEDVEGLPQEIMVNCPLCDAVISERATQCPKCGARFLTEMDMAGELDALGQAAIQERVKEELGGEDLFVPSPARRAPKPEKAPAKPLPEPKVVAPPTKPAKTPARQGFTNGSVRARKPAARPAGMTNGLRGRTNGLTNGLRGRTNGLTNGLRGRTNGLTNGLGRTNGLTNGLRGRTNGLTNGLGHTNGVTNGLTNGLVSLRRGMTNGLTNGNGFTNGLGSPRFHREIRLNRWKLYVIPIVAMALLLVPLFTPPEYANRQYPIQIDGAFADWTPSSIVDVNTNAQMNPNIDIVRFGIADNLDYLAFYVEVAGTVLQGGGSLPGTMDTVRIFVDTDNSSATGYRIDGIGADRMIEISGYGGVVSASGLWEFDANRNPNDWSGWIKGTGTPAAVSGSRVETEAEWLLLEQGSMPVTAIARTQSWDGQTDVADVPISLTLGTLLATEESQAAQILTGSNVPLLKITLTVERRPVTFDSVRVRILGTGSPSEASSLRLTDESGNGLAQTAPASRDVPFQFSPQTLAVGSTSTYYVRGDFAGASGNTFGVRLAASQAIGTQDGTVAVRTSPVGQWLGYVGSMPSVPRVDGAFGEWSSPSTDPANDSVPRANADIDLLEFGRLADSGSFFLYADVAGRLLAGTPVPKSPAPATSGGPPPLPDSDRDTVPDDYDPYPFDFNNDATPDAQTAGDYDQDGITDYGFTGGTDYWLNTTIPTNFQAPYGGRVVSVYIGPTNRPAVVGEDVLRIFLDLDNSTWSGFSIGGLGADRMVEVRGKNGEVSSAGLFSFAGSYPGDWVWNPLSPLTVAMGYHAIELSVGFNASRVYLETGDFWGDVDSPGGGPIPFTLSASSTIESPSGSSFAVPAAATPLAVPWYQLGPQTTATLIDASSNAATTPYNHQRKVVRAGDVAGQTACEATNSDGCWYVIFYDQLSATDYTSGPTTETMTAGTRASGAFPTDVLSSNNAYINYREANTGTLTTVTQNPTATGTNPGCTWGTCANGESSDDAYATSSTQNQRLSFKTFGFSLPSGATISSVRVGIEAFAVATDGVTGITLSWNAGTTYCSNTQIYNTLPNSDPNSYTYFDFTSCTGHTWTQADFTGDNIAFDSLYLKVGSPGNTVSVDAVAVEVKYTPIEYTLVARHDFTNVPSGDTVTLSVEAYHSAGEDFAVQVLTLPNAWNPRITVTATTDPNTAQTYVLTVAEFNSGSPSIRLVDTVTADLTQSDLWVDLSVLTTTMTKSPSTETITTGTKVSGTFSTDISSSNNAYINYREANTGTQTTVTNNAGAVGTNPACAFTNCANGRTSDNSYATSSVDTTVLSYKTFGFSLPSSISIDSVQVGIEAFRSINDGLGGITLSWDGGTSYCTNPGSLSLPMSDPNAYAYVNLTTCAGHTWAQADFTGDNIAFKASHAAQGGAETISVDAVAVEVKYTPLQYQLLVKYDFSSVPTEDVYSLKVEAYHSAGEDVAVQVWSGAAWNSRITITATSDPNSAQTYVLTTAEYNSGSPSIRFVDASGSDTTQSDLWIDMAVITTTSYWDRVFLMRSSDTGGSTWGSQVLLASGRIGDDPLLYNYDSAEPSIAMDSSGYLHVVWVSAASKGNQQTMNLVRYTKTTVAYPSQSQLASSSNWQTVVVVDDTSTGYMPTVSTDTGNYPHLAWSGSKTSGTAYYKNRYGGSWRTTVSWGTAYTGMSVDVSPQNNYVSLARYYEAATNEIQYTVCKGLAASDCDLSTEFTKSDGSAGYNTVATAVEFGSYPSLATTYDANGDLWIAYAQDVGGSARAIYARFLDYPSAVFAAVETVDSLAATVFTKPTIGVDRNNNAVALYSTSGGALYIKAGSGGVWGARTSVDTSSQDPSLTVRAPNNVTYGDDVGAVYWKSSSTETDFYTLKIPEFEVIFLPVAGVFAIAMSALRRRRKEEGVGLDPATGSETPIP